MPSLTLYEFHCTYEDRNGSATDFPFESLAKPIEAWLIIQRIGAKYLPERVILHVAHLIFGEINVCPGQIIVYGKRSVRHGLSIDFDDLFRAMKAIKASEEFVSHVPIVVVVGHHEGALRKLEMRIFGYDPEVFFFHVNNIQAVVDDDPEVTLRSVIHGDYCAVCAFKQCGCPDGGRGAANRSKECRNDHYEVNKIERFDAFGPSSKVKLSRFYVDSRSKLQEIATLGRVSQTIELSHLRILLSDYSVVNTFEQLIGVPRDADYGKLDELYRGSLPLMYSDPTHNAKTKGQSPAPEAPEGQSPALEAPKGQSPAPEAPEEVPAPESPAEPKDPKKIVIAVESEDAPIVTIEINGFQPSDLKRLAACLYGGTSEFKPIGDSFIKVEEHVVTVLGKSMVAKYFRRDAFQKSFGVLYPDVARIGKLLGEWQDLLVL